MNPDRYHFLPMEKALEGSRAHIVYNYLDSYWVMHPEKGLAFWDKGYSSPQCNRNEALAKHLCPDWGVIVFMKVVQVPCNISDYQER